MKTKLPVAFNVTADVFGFIKGYIVEMFNDDFSLCVTPDQAEGIAILFMKKAAEARLKQESLSKTLENCASDLSNKLHEIVKCGDATLDEAARRANSSMDGEFKVEVHSHDPE